MSFRNLDLNLLKVFDAVMLEQNLTRAADRLAMTQPAVSNAIKRLREALGDELLIRTAHGVKPTARAEYLWPTIKNSLIKLEETLTPSNFNLSTSSISFRMAMADATASLLLPSLVRLLEKEAPNINIRMVPLTTREPRPMLIRSDIDLAIGFFPGVVAQLKGSTDTLIQHSRIYESEYVCVMNKNHSLANKDLTVDDYCNSNHILVSFSGRARGLVDDALLNFNNKRRILLTVNQFFTAGKVVASTNLLMVLPQHLVEATGITEKIVVKKLPFKMPIVSIDMLWHERDTQNSAHVWLRKQFNSIFS